MILASAGSGKTWQLTNRYIALMAQDLLAGNEPRPERILAITFTRKAAGEFFDSILKKIARAASSEEEARALAGPPDHPLYPILSQLSVTDYKQLLAVFIRRMPKLFLGTLDSFFANILRAFPAEFGLAGDFEIMDDHQARLAREKIYQHVFHPSQDQSTRDEFLEAFRLATFGKEDTSIRYLLDRFIDRYHAIFLFAARHDLWGNEHTIWPQGCPWLQATGEHQSDLEQLFEVFSAQAIADKQLDFWYQFRDELLAHTPGNSIPYRVGFFLKKFLEAWNDIQAGHAEFLVNRVRQTFDDEACDIPFEGNPQAVLAAVRQALDGLAIDMAALPADGRRKKLLIADMDSTLIEQECIDELADEIGHGATVSAITERAMRGEIEFEPALRERVALLAGLPAAIVDDVLERRITLMPGGRTLVQTMRAHGAHTSLVSGGFTVFAGPIGERLGFDDFRANILLAGSDGLFSGQVAEPILGRQAKEQTLRLRLEEHGLAPADALAVGDGANDLAMIALAGLGVAFHAKPAVRKQADAAIEHNGLTALLYLQGYHRDEFTS